MHHLDELALAVAQLSDFVQNVQLRPGKANNGTVEAVAVVGFPGRPAVDVQGTQRQQLAPLVKSPRSGAGTLAAQGIQSARTQACYSSCA